MVDCTPCARSKIVPLANSLMVQTFSRILENSSIPEKWHCGTTDHVGSCGSRNLFQYSGKFNRDGSITRTRITCAVRLLPDFPEPRIWGVCMIAGRKGVSAMHPLAHVPSVLPRRSQQANVGTTSNRQQGAHWSIAMKPS